MKNKSTKVILALTLVTAGSVFYGTEQAEAKGLELDGIQIIFGRHHRNAPPPPPPPHYEPMPPHRHHAHMPTPPPPHHREWQMRDRGPGHDRRDFRPEPPRGHMPPPRR